MGSEETIYQQLDHNLTSKFVGCDTLEHSSVITALTTETEIVKELVTGQRGTVIVEETPFYATSGGQSADIGVIINDLAEFTVEDVVNLQGGKIGHIGTLSKGNLKVSDKVTLKVNSEHRADTAKNHSATRYLLQALRMVLESC